MDKDFIQTEYRRWMELAVEDPDLQEELCALAADEEKLQDAFYRNLEFGTGGLRGVIGADGCQITTKAASEILTEIEKLDLFRDIKRLPFEAGIVEGTIRYIEKEVEDEFIAAVRAQSVLGSSDHIDRDMAIVYSPLNGTGLKPVCRVLQEAGFTNLTIVKEQEQPDGAFPTCPYPNPEIKEAMTLGIEYAKRNNADLLLATDPDCDRVGIAVKNTGGEYVLLSGNETGMLLLDYICARRRASHTMPENPVIVKTIVTIDMAERIAQAYGVSTVNVLTGFKYIGEQIGLLEKQGRTQDYILGFEESYGYLSGSYVRDKDAVNGAFLICEMSAYYKAHGISLWEKLQELYEQYGYCLNTLHSYTFEGAAGFARMQAIMEVLRRGIRELGGLQVEKCLDYAQGLDGLPKSDVLKFRLEKDCSVVVRPSGTEPKLKAYFSVSAGNRDMAERIEEKLTEDLEKRFFKSYEKNTL
ncbi:MAG: phospho-sugar mutase [Lachnospiraceae bacterium]|jgi:phosphoglucomutase|nr:phospho-sugar mutase [Lachnospiraceae bacterium]